MTDNQLMPYIKRKYYIITNRVTHHPSYVRKQITNEFKGMEEFTKHCLDNGFQPHLVCHRPNRNASYSTKNLVFISREEHLKISGIEKRKLNPMQVEEIERLSKSGKSTWKIASMYNVSQHTVWKLINKRSYLN